MVPELQVRMSMLQQYEFFNRMLKLSQFAAVYEYGRVCTYGPGERVMALHRRSKFHPLYHSYYDLKANRLLEEFELQLSRPSQKKLSSAPQTFYEGLLTTVKKKKSPKKVKGGKAEPEPVPLPKVPSDFSESLSLRMSPTEEQRPAEEQKIMHSGRKGARNGGPETSEPQLEDPPHTPTVIILEGKCQVINPIDGHLVATLTKGDVFGDSDFLKYTVRPPISNN